MTVFMFFSGFIAACLDLAMPALCPACRQTEGPGICLDCRMKMIPLHNPCRYCGAPEVKADGTCRVCLGDGFSFIDSTLAVYPYAQIIKSLIGDAKTVGRPAAVRALAGLMPALDQDISPSAWVVPVPPARGRRPGPHLATALARELARRHRLPCHQVLKPTRLPAEQHRLGMSDRQRNVDGLFMCAKKVPAQIILVDDLLTSGATISSAASALRGAGARRVMAVCLARTPRKDEKGDEDSLLDNVQDHHGSMVTWI